MNPGKVFVYTLFIAAFGLLMFFLQLAGLDKDEYVVYGVFLLLFFSFLVFLRTDLHGFISFVFFALPFSNRFFNFEVSVITLSPFTAGVIFLAGLGVLQVALGGKRYSVSLFDVAALALCTIYFISTILSKDLMRSGHLAFHALFIPIISYFVLRVFVRTRDQFRLVFSFFMLGIVLFALANTVQYLLVMQRGPIFEVWPVSAATVIVVGLIYYLYSGKMAGLWGKVCAGICLAGLFLTFSRAYLALLLISPLLWFFIRRGRALILFMVMFTATLAFTLAVSLSVQQKHLNYMRYASSLQKYGYQLDDQFKEDEKSAGRLFSIDHMVKSMYYRALVYRMGLENFMENPMFGTGIHEGNINVTQHNFHIEWLEYSGLIGYLLYGSLFFIYFMRFGRTAKRNNLVAVLVLTQLCVLTNSFTNGFMHGMFPYMSFLVTGFSFAAEEVGEGEAECVGDGAKPSRAVGNAA